tara:strand:- start:812 stop:1159 length:348 start_codon:yes stop_codon:yes gene_type:complete
MQQLKTINVKTTAAVESVHWETLYAVLQNAYNNLQLMEMDGTASSYFVNTANIYAQLAAVYAAHVDAENYIALSTVMECFTNNITYYDEEHMYTECVANTAMQHVKLLDYTYLSN